MVVANMFIPIWGNDPNWQAYFSKGLKSPTRHNYTNNDGIFLSLLGETFMCWAGIALSQWQHALQGSSWKCHCKMVEKKHVIRYKYYSHLFAYLFQHCSCHTHRQVKSSNVFKPLSTTSGMSQKKTITLPETNISHLKMDGWKMKFPFGAWPIFRGELSVSGRLTNHGLLTTY